MRKQWRKSRDQKRPQKNQVCDYFLDVQRNRLNVADAINRSKQVGDSGDLPKARSILEKEIENIQNSMSAKDDLSKKMIDDLKDALNDMQDKKDYFEKAQKKMVWKAQAHSQERAVGKGSYETSAKMEMKKKFSKPSASVSTPIPNLVTLNKKILVGNEYEEVAENQATESVALPGTKNTHKWKMFVRGQDVEPDIEKVIFHLHPTFQPSKITVSAAPFELERSGWGTFTVRVEVHFKPALNKPMCQFEHDLWFEPKGSSKEYTV